MGWFHDEASREAARHFGRRYHRWYLTLHLLRPLLPALGVLLTLAVAVGTVRTLAGQVPWPVVLRLAALLPLAVLLGWVAVQLLTGASVARRAAGRRSPIPTLAITAILALLAASVLVH